MRDPAPLTGLSVTDETSEYASHIDDVSGRGVVSQCTLNR